MQDNLIKDKVEYKWKKGNIIMSGDFGIRVVKKADIKAGIMTVGIPIDKFIENLLSLDRQELLEKIEGLKNQAEKEYTKTLKRHDLLALSLRKLSFGRYQAFREVLELIKEK